MSGGIRRVGRIYFWLGVGMAGITVWGFSRTYFGPIAAGDYPEVSPWVHVHGWSFFLWYLLLPLQAGLVTGGRIGLHRRLGISSVLLAALMVFAGILGLSTRLADALAGAGEGGFPWLTFGPGILFALILFTGFYLAALISRARPAYHKRWMIVASCPPLSAAVFRIFTSWFSPWPDLFAASLLATNLFIVIGMIHDRIREGRVHRAYLIGLSACVFFEALAVPIAGTSAGAALNRAVASVHDVIGFLY